MARFRSTGHKTRGSATARGSTADVRCGAAPHLSACTEVTVAETEACIAAQWAQQAEMFAAMAEMTCEDMESAEPSDDMEMMEELPLLKEHQPGLKFQKNMANN